MQTRFLSLACLVAALCLSVQGTVTTTNTFDLHPIRSVPTSWHQVEDASCTSAALVPDLTRITVNVVRRNMAQLDAIFWTVSDPRHPSYGKHLTSQETRELIGLPEAERKLVEQWLTSVDSPKLTFHWNAHYDAVIVHAPMSVLETLLGTKFCLFEEIESGRLLYRAPGATKLPVSLRNIVEVVSGHAGFPAGLQPNAIITGTKKVLPQKQYSDSSSSSGGSSEASSSSGSSSNSPKQTLPNVTPATLYDVYNVTSFPTLPHGAVHIQSFFQSQGQYTNATELSTFCENILAPGLTRVDPNLTPVTISERCHITKFIGNNSDVQPGTNGESSLDSQYLLSTSALEETYTYSYLNYDFCGDLSHWAADVFDEIHGNGVVFPRVISMSYGSQQTPDYCLGPEVERLSRDIQKMGVVGISVMIASGDDGSGEYYNHGQNYNNGLLSPSFPASSPYCTAVGATTFVTGSSGEQMATTQFGSGGGFSYDYPIPPYQANVIPDYFKQVSKLPPSLSYNASGRGTPDVAVLGEGFNVITNGQVQLIGGTSASTPAFSGFVTLLNHIRLQKGKSTLGFLNVLLYQNPHLFTDITVGNNDVMGDGYGWQTTKGWDPVTGLGTPNVGRMMDFVASLP